MNKKIIEVQLQNTLSKTQKSYYYPTYNHANYLTFVAYKYELKYTNGYYESSFHIVILSKKTMIGLFEKKIEVEVRKSHIPI